MKRFHSLMLAAAASAAVTMSAAAPAAADQGEGRIARAFVAGHRALHAARPAIMRGRPPTQIASANTDTSCRGFWCRRDFVLILGIGF
ncbi:hypothetical protein [Bradyrhizobium sp. DOA9]|uniref:hypothetical protein n=1 Tax=Bradyrhizobium sp. DOA9 TaxID=1126627 RepID=UPI000B33D156|nr:hypothetical protein [Bradyrhizobium sp. DOA9]